MSKERRSAERETPLARMRVAPPLAVDCSENSPRSLLGYSPAHSFLTTYSSQQVKLVWEFFL